VNLDHAQWDMPAATVTGAVEYLVPADPLYDMLCTHLHHLARTAAAAPLLLDHLECATVRLARVLVASAADDEARHRESLEHSLPARLRLYIESNLTDPCYRQPAPRLWSPNAFHASIPRRVGMSSRDWRWLPESTDRLTVCLRCAGVKGRVRQHGCSCPGNAESPPTRLGGFR
jgi:hypothetical protein